MGAMKNLAIKLQEGSKLTKAEKEYIEWEKDQRKRSMGASCTHCLNMCQDEVIRTYEGNQFCSESCRIGYEIDRQYQEQHYLLKSAQ